MLVCCEKGSQVTFHSMTSSDDSVLTSGTDLGIQLVVTAAADEMTSRALHDPGILSHVLKADRAFRVRDLGSLCRAATSNLSPLLHEILH